MSDFRPAQEATAFQYRNDAIQIYSNSYGPTDDGFSVGGPGPESIGAIDIGVNQVRLIIIMIINIFKLDCMVYQHTCLHSAIAFLLVFVTCQSPISYDCCIGHLYNHDTF